MTTPSVPFKVAPLRRHIGQREDYRDTVALGDVSTSAAALAPPGEVAADLVLESCSDGVVVRGTVEVPWVGACRRCLEPATGRVESSVRELFSDGFERESVVSDDDPSEGVEVYPIDGDWIDLGPLLHETAVLALPLAPLCSAGCGGPEPEEFPVHTELDPPEPTRDPRWDALSELRFDAD